MKNSISFCSKVAEISSDYEKVNTDLKRTYISKQIMLYNEIAKQVEGNCGTFGTGYPFYILNSNLEGQLPVIDEQIRYNNELLSAVIHSDFTTWNCYDCLQKNYKDMPDLKKICRPCPNMDNELKPRKIINRLPDIDIWMVCEDKNIVNAKDSLINLFNEYNLQPSDIDPIRTIHDLEEIKNDLYEGNMPTKYLPIDAHIINYNTLYSLIKQVPSVLEQSKENNCIPYLPIHPLSYRKVWQYDDTAYNFIHDYLSSLTEFNLDNDLMKVLCKTRNLIANSYSIEELYNYLIASGPESVKRRHKTLELKNRFNERIDSWKKL